MMQKNYNMGVSKVGIMDERGSGILRMEEAMEKWELEKPNYAEKDGYFVITFKGPSRAEKPLDEEILKNLNERQKKALEYIKIRGKVTNKEYRDICTVNRIMAFRDLSELVKKKIIEKIGKTGRWAYYILKR